MDSPSARTNLGPLLHPHHSWLWKTEDVDSQAPPDRDDHDLDHWSEHSVASVQWWRIASYSWCPLFGLVALASLASSSALLDLPGKRWWLKVLLGFKVLKIDHYLQVANAVVDVCFRLGIKRPLSWFHSEKFLTLKSISIIFPVVQPKKWLHEITASLPVYQSLQVGHPFQANLANFGMDSQIMTKMIAEELVDGWKTLFVAPNSSPFLIGNMYTPSSLHSVFLLPPFTTR